VISDYDDNERLSSVADTDKNTTRHATHDDSRRHDLHDLHDSVTVTLPLLMHHLPIMYE
jgi:hypothetical protein